MPIFEPRTVLPDDLTDAVYVHVIGAVGVDRRRRRPTRVAEPRRRACSTAPPGTPSTSPPTSTRATAPSSTCYGFHGRAGQEAWLAAGRAVQLVEWGRTHRFCGRCGTPTEPAPGERAMRCPACGLSAFPRLAPAMITLVTRGDDGPDQEALLARGIQWKVPMYSCLAGFVEPGESLEGAVVREVKEEVGVDVDDVRYQGSQPWPFPHSLMCGFRARYESRRHRLRPDRDRRRPVVPPRRDAEHPARHLDRPHADQRLARRGVAAPAPRRRRCRVACGAAPASR